MKKLLILMAVMLISMALTACVSNSSQDSYESIRYGYDQVVDEDVSVTCYLETSEGIEVYENVQSFDFKLSGYRFYWVAEDGTKVLINNATPAWCKYIPTDNDNIYGN